MNVREIAEKWTDSAIVNNVNVAFVCGQLEDIASYKDELSADIDAAIAAAVQEERISCELFLLRSRDECTRHSLVWHTLDNCATAIRARGEAKP